MSKIKYLFIHCTATPVAQNLDKDDIIRMHTSPKSKGGRGWSRPGYNDMIYLDGSLVNLIPFDQDDFVDSWEISNGAKGLNGISRHIVYVGGLDNMRRPTDTRNKAQMISLETYVRYMLLRHPHIKIGGHNQVANKACPCFHAPQWLETIGVPRRNIY